MMNIIYNVKTDLPSIVFGYLVNSVLLTGNLLLSTTTVITSPS